MIRTVVPITQPSPSFTHKLPLRSFASVTFLVYWTELSSGSHGVIAILVNLLFFFRGIKMHTSLDRGSW